MKKTDLIVILALGLGPVSMAPASSAESFYRQAEELESHLLVKPALKYYRKAMSLSDPVWKRRAAFRAATLIRDFHFHQGRSDKVRQRIVTLYQAILRELVSLNADLELRLEIQKELPWTRLGLSAPNHLF